MLKQDTALHRLHIAELPVGRGGVGVLIGQAVGQNAALRTEVVGQGVLLAVQIEAVDAGRVGAHGAYPRAAPGTALRRRAGLALAHQQGHVVPRDQKVVQRHRGLGSRNPLPSAHGSHSSTCGCAGQRLPQTRARAAQRRSGSAVRRSRAGVASRATDRAATRARASARSSAQARPGTPTRGSPELRFRPPRRQSLRLRRPQPSGARRSRKRLGELLGQHDRRPSGSSGWPGEIAGDHPGRPATGARRAAVSGHQVQPCGSPSRPLRGDDIHHPHAGPQQRVRRGSPSRFCSTGRCAAAPAVAHLLSSSRRSGQSAARGPRARWGGPLPLQARGSTCQRPFHAVQLPSTMTPHLGTPPPYLLGRSGRVPGWPAARQTAASGSARWCSSRRAHSRPAPDPARCSPAATVTLSSSPRMKASVSCKKKVFLSIPGPHYWLNFGWFAAPCGPRSRRRGGR